MNPKPPDPLIGQLLDGRYRVDARLAGGGMATVYRATDTRLDRAVALKVMRSEFADDPEFVSRFQQEARAAARLSHPNVVNVSDQGESDGLVFLVMELVPGRTLRSILDEHGSLSPSQSLAVLDQVLQGVAAAHRAGFVHRDIKPENVLISRDSEVKVTDFGLARALQDPSGATRGMLIGTAAYLAPEHVTDGRSDERSDIYQAGILLYELLSGTLPHTGDSAWSVAYSHVNQDVPSVREVAPDVPDDLAALVHDATRRDPDERISSVEEFLDRSRSIASLLPPPAQFTSGTDTIVITDSGPLPGDHPGGTAAPTEVTDLPPTHTRISDMPPPVAAAAGGRTRPPDPEPPGNRVTGGRWFIRMLLLLLALAATGLAAWTIAENPFNRADVPKVLGMAETKAEKRLERSGFQPTVADRRFSETATPGTVISTDPRVGSSARVGSAVSLIVSLGPERYPVPVVRGLTPDDAADRLRAANLAVGKEKLRYHDEVEPGQVIRTAPKKNSKLKRDTLVHLYISKGPAPVQVPDVAGLSGREAQARLADLGLDSNIADEEETQDIPKGLVARTSPAAGVTLNRGDEVDLIISTGPRPVEVPDVINMTRSEAAARLEAAGFKVKVDEGSFTPLDRVYSQDPDPGTEIPKGDTVTISVL